MNNKGQIPTTILVVVGLVFGILAVVGVLTGSFQSMFTFFFSYKWSLATLVLILASAVVIIKNVSAKEPQWKKDFIGIGGMMALLILAIFFIPAVSGAVTDYQADITTTVNYDGRITGMEVDNIKPTSPMSILQFNNALGIVWQRYQVKSVAYCEGDNGYAKVTERFSDVNPSRLTEDSTKITITGLHDRCYIKTTTSLRGNIIDEQKQYFTVG